MTCRSFVFCDICNPHAVRTADARRGGDRLLDGRHDAESRMWFEGSEDEAAGYGWFATEDGQHICPCCVERLKAMKSVLEDRLFCPVAVAQVRTH